MISRELLPAPPVTRRYVVCRREDLEPGQARAFRVGSRSVAVVRLPNDAYRAVSNTCPHEAASLARGRVEKMWTSDGVGEHESSERCVIVCPWHNFEFDIETGRSPCEPDRVDMALRTYAVSVDGEDVVVYA